MIPCRVRICVLVCLLAAGPAVGQEKKAETITLKKALEEMDKKIALLQGDELEAQFSKIRKAESDPDRSVAVKTFIDRHGVLVESQISQQRLRIMERLQAKGSPVNKTLDSWVEQANKPTSKLPQPPDPGLIQDFEAIDKYALGTPVEMTKSIPKLAQYLTKEAKNDKEKARAIYKWIIENVVYDLDNATKTSWRSDLVLQSKRCTCLGFATLFEALAKQSGLATSTIRGRSRVFEDIVGSPQTVRLTNGLLTATHAWNAIKLDGKLYFVDPTWGCQSILRKGKIEPSLSSHTDYFLVPAEALVYTHMPEDPRMQQLKNPLMKKEQEGLPVCKPSFFRFGLKFGSAPQPTLSVRDTVLVTLEGPADVELRAIVSMFGKVYSTPQTPIQTLVQAHGDVAEIRAILPDAGAYQLSIIARKKKERSKKDDDDLKNWEVVVEYRVDAQGAKGSPPLPVALLDLGRKGAYLYHPLAGDLKAQKPQSFAVAVPGAAQVYIQCGEKRTPLEKHGDLFVGEVTPDAGNVFLIAEFQGQTALPVLVKFHAK